MSYIRCTSNPEGLYIYGDCESRINITHTVKRPLSSGRDFTIPEKSFERVCKAWERSRGDAAYRGVEVKEMQVYTRTGRPVPPDRSIKATFKSKAPTEILIRLSYRGDFVFMWRVTWDYVVANVCAR